MVARCRRTWFAEAACLIKILLVFIIVAVEAEELPVAPVRRIVVVIVVNL